MEGGRERETGGRELREERVGGRREKETVRDRGREEGKGEEKDGKGRKKK